MKSLKKEKLKKAVFPSVLALIYAVFIFSPDFPKTKPALIIWFIGLSIVIGAGLYRYIRYIKKGFSFSGWKVLEFLLPLLLLSESVIQFLGQPVFRLFYIPFIVVLASDFPLKIVISCILAIFLLGIPTTWWSKGYLTEESGSYLSILVTGIISYYIFYKKLKISRKAQEDLQKLKRSAMSLEASTEASLFDEDRFSHLVKTILDVEKELKEILNLIKKVINADSVTLFILEGDNLIGKTSTENGYLKPKYHGEAYLLNITKGKKPLIQPRLKHSLFDLGYASAKEAGASLCVPVLDGNVSLGVIEAVSKKESAFGEREKDVVVSFAFQIGEMLRRARTYIEVERFAKGFKSLHEVSRMLSTSLKVEEIADTLVELVFGMVQPSAVGFFIPDKGELRIIAKKGFEPEDESFYTKGTYFDLIIKNKHTLHFSNLVGINAHRGGRQGVYPFGTAKTKTFLGIPILSPENDVLGILALTSTEPTAISAFYGHFLNVVADQAALFITNARLHKEVERLAVTDGLTGLYNHRHFQERLSEEFQRIERIPHTLSMILIDLDHFKKINDIYGHPTGDVVLKGLASILKKTLRGIDIIARYGGEEFAAVLLNTESKGAYKIAERLRTKVMHTPFFAGENKLLLTLSIGIATYPHDAVTKEELISRTDQALYYAKKKGRNQVCVWKGIAGKS